jgi:hypothetical protein
MSIASQTNINPPNLFERTGFQLSFYKISTTTNENCKSCTYSKKYSLAV